MCAVICRKATVALPDANYLSSWCQSPSSRAQNRHFCALLGSGTPVFGCFEHKIEVFVLFGDLEPSFSSISSTKSGFLCFFGLRDPCFRAFRAQNRGFCALLGSGTPVFGHFEHKIGIFVRFCPSKPLFSGVSSTKSGFLCSRGGESGIGKRNRGDAYHFAAAPTPSHQRTSTPAPAHQHQLTSPATAPSNGTRRRQVLSWHHVVLSMRRQVLSGAV